MIFDLIAASTEDANELRYKYSRWLNEQNLKVIGTENNRLTIEINSVEDLLKLKEAVGEALIIGDSTHYGHSCKYTVEIYDYYIE